MPPIGNAKIGLVFATDVNPVNNTTENNINIEDLTFKSLNLI
jgi:hypothetical protein